MNYQKRTCSDIEYIRKHTIEKQSATSFSEYNSSYHAWTQTFFIMREQNLPYSP